MKKNNIYDPENHEVFHETDPDKVKKRLNGFYGKVARLQDQRIEKNIVGKKVLDVGSGYGYLLGYLNEQGFDAIGLEPAPKEAKFARDWWKVKVVEGSIYETVFKDDEFETVILRDVIFHLELEKALKEIKRINQKRVVVFMGNTGWLLKFTKWVLRHREHNMQSLSDYTKIFQSKGYEKVTVEFSDYFAFPLSGGYISRAFVPNCSFCHKLVLAIEKGVEKVLGFLQLKKVFAFRALLVFEKK